MRNLEKIFDGIHSECFTPSSFWA